VLSSLTPASIAPEKAGPPLPPSLVETCARMIRQQLPNFFRLYLNPFVVQTCFCLSRLVQKTWAGAGSEPWQSFLANSCDEALSGAIKLARYECNRANWSPAGLVIDPTGRLGYFAAIPLKDGGRIECVPDLTVNNGTDAELQAIAAGKRFGFVVLVASPAQLGPTASASLDALLREQSALLITCVGQGDFEQWRRADVDALRERVPDIVVFDESFVRHQVPFAAFTAPRHRFAAWNKVKQGAFHSTTYQPNTISTLHFLRCLENAEPELCSQLQPELERIRREPAHCVALLGALYSPFLARTIPAVGFATNDIRAEGHYVSVEGKRIFDGVAGIACSIRGHNPEPYADEIKQAPPPDSCQETLATTLKQLTGLEQYLPAVSGASAVETGLRLALAAQHPRKFVVAFQGGFGGKTLLALTGTANPSYKTHLDPLYHEVIYLDPFAPSAIDNLEAILRKHPVAVVQLELIQAVGGVRAIPSDLVRYLDENKRRWGYLLFVDEVQTGMYRTGPFVRSRELGISPDILTLGKGTSDMMFPFGLTLYSSEVAERLARLRPDLPDSIRQRHSYDIGYQTVANTLRRAEENNLASQVREKSELFARLLTERLAGCKAVREVRAYGMLIGIELETTGWPQRWLKKRLASLYLLSMMRHSSFPVLVGYCQYEPNVLKFTPPLSITPDETRQVCDTIGDVLRRPLFRVVGSAIGWMAKSFARRARQGLGGRS
jgi:acetylornithine/succinyldiaminopimelate/putrescine aminotransferase